MQLAVTIKATATNPNIGDLMLGDDGDEVVLDDLAAEVSQLLFVRLQFFRGEWFLDAEEGVPYFERILVKGVNDRVIRSIFSNIIEGTPGVHQLRSFQYTVGRDRKMSIQFVCSLDNGQVFRSSDYAQFIVTG